jgi:hypothetical protein
MGVPMTKAGCGGLTPREIVRRVIHFQSPPRVGLYFSRFGQNDTVDVYDFFQKDAAGFDLWGTQWALAEGEQAATIGIPKTPPLKSEAEIGLLRAPDAHEQARRAMANLAALKPEDRDKYRFIATSSGIWERVQYWRGMETLFADMIENPGLVHRLVGICTDFWVRFLAKLAPARGEFDALYMFDDWGAQTGAMISPAMWREFYAEPYRRIVDAAHAAGMDFWLHSCGRVTDLIEEFIRAGMDLVNPYQSGACGYEEVARRYAGRIAFLTTVDTQSTLIHGTPANVLAECRRLAKWATPQGGLIVASYPFDTPEANERTVFDYFTECFPEGVNPSGTDMTRQKDTMQNGGEG